MPELLIGLFQTISDETELLVFNILRCKRINIGFPLDFRPHGLYWQKCSLPVLKFIMQRHAGTLLAHDIETDSWDVQSHVVI